MTYHRAARGGVIALDAVDKGCDEAFAARAIYGSKLSAVLLRIMASKSSMSTRLR